MQTDNELGDKGEVKPRVDQDDKLEGKIEDEKDEVFAAGVEESHEGS